MPKLVFEKGNDKGKTVVLSGKGAIILGRDVKAHVQISDAMSSRQHFKIFTRNDKYFLRDLHSSNGVFLNGVKVSEAELREGDKIQIGETLISFVGDKEDEKKDAMVGRVIDGYKILERVGRGGMGTVYKATQLSLNRTVALKVLSPELVKDSTFIERFRNEARAAAALNHPNIVQVYDVGKQEGADLYYMSMEFMGRGSVQDAIGRNSKLSLEVALPIMIDAAKGLDYAERKKIVHRDIKPDNLMVNEEGAIKVIDLGLALNPVEQTQEDGIYGTPHYIAPEQAMGKEIDHRADLYAVGGTFYRILSGQTPFAGPTVKEIVKKQIKEKPKPLKEVAPELPDDVCKLVMKLLEKTPEDRYQHATDVLQELKDIQFRLESRNDRTGPAITQVVQRSNRSTMIALAVTVLLLAGIFAIVWGVSQNQGAQTDEKNSVVEVDKDLEECERQWTQVKATIEGIKRGANSSTLGEPHFAAIIQECEKFVGQWKAQSEKNADLVGVLDKARSELSHYSNKKNDYLNIKKLWLETRIPNTEKSIIEYVREKDFRAANDLIAGFQKELSKESRLTLDDISLLCDKFEDKQLDKMAAKGLEKAIQSAVNELNAAVERIESGATAREVTDAWSAARGYYRQIRSEWTVSNPEEDLMQIDEAMRMVDAAREDKLEKLKELGEKAKSESKKLREQYIETARERLWSGGRITDVDFVSALEILRALLEGKAHHNEVQKKYSTDLAPIGRLDQDDRNIVAKEIRILEWAAEAVNAVNKSLDEMPRTLNVSIFKKMDKVNRVVARGIQGVIQDGGVKSVVSWETKDLLMEHVQQVFDISGEDVAREGYRVYAFFYLLKPELPVAQSWKAVAATKLSNALNQNLPADTKDIIDYMLTHYGKAGEGVDQAAEDDASKAWSEFESEFGRKKPDYDKCELLLLAIDEQYRNTEFLRQKAIANKKSSSMELIQEELLKVRSRRFQKHEEAALDNLELGASLKKYYESMIHAHGSLDPYWGYNKLLSARKDYLLGNYYQAWNAMRDEMDRVATIDRKHLADTFPVFMDMFFAAGALAQTEEEKIDRAKLLSAMDAITANINMGGDDGDVKNQGALIGAYIDWLTQAESRKKNRELLEHALERDASDIMARWDLAKAYLQNRDYFKWRCQLEVLHDFFVRRDGKEALEKTGGAWLVVGKLGVEEFNAYRLFAYAMYGEEQFNELYKRMLDNGEALERLVVREEQGAFPRVRLAAGDAVYFDLLCYFLDRQWFVLHDPDFCPPADRKESYKDVIRFLEKAKDFRKDGSCRLESMVISRSGQFLFRAGLLKYRLADDDKESKSLMNKYQEEFLNAKFVPLEVEDAAKKFLEDIKLLLPTPK